MKQPGILDFIIVSIIGLAILLLAFVIFYRNKKENTNKAFFIFALSVNAWICSAFLSELNIFEQYRLFLSRLAYASVSAAIVLLFNLILSFSKRWLQSRYWGLIRNFYFIFASLVIAFALLTNLIIKGIKYQSWGFDLANGTLYSIFPLFILSCVIVIFISMVASYIKTQGHAKKQIQYLLIGLFLFVGTSAFINVVLRQILGTDEYYRLGNYSVIFFIAFTAFAIIRHRLMDIRLLVLRAVSWTLFIALIAGGYITLTVVVFQKLEGIVNPIVLNVITLFILMFTFNPIRRFIENHTNRLFSKGRYNPAELRKKLEEISLKYAKQEDLIKNWLEVIASQMKINRAAVVLTNSPQLSHIEQLNFKISSTKPWQKLANILNENKKMIVADEIDDEADIKERLREMGIEVLLPIRMKKEMTGFFALGAKRSGDMFTSQDLNLLNNFLRNSAVALERSKEMKEKEKEVVKVKALYNQAQKSVSSVDLGDVLASTIEAAFKATSSDGGSIMLYDEKTKTLTISASRGIPKELHFKKTKLGEGIAGKIALSKKGRIISSDDKEFAYLLKRAHLRSAISEPLMISDKLVGILNVNRVNSKEAFGKGDQELVQTIAAHIAQRIENAKLVEEDREKDKEVINIFAKAVETRDPYTHGHSEMVTYYSVAIAKEMGLDKKQIIKIEKAGVLHDIGKIGIPDNILLKPKSLTDAEYEKIKEHPLKSMNLIMEYSKLKDIALIALYHHERFDGKGYPKGLSAEDIPLESRILAVADSFDAMTSDRPYRVALSLSIAKKEIKKGADTQFDPEVAEVFLRIVDKIYRKKQKKGIKILAGRMK